MPSDSLGTETFTNKKSKLFGSVNGVDPVNQLSYPTPLGIGSSSGTVNNFVETIYDSIILNATSPINKGFIRKTTGIDWSGNGMTFRIREDDINGAIINIVDFGGGVKSTVVTLSATITNQPIGNRTYVFTINQSGIFGNFYRFHSPTPETFSSVTSLAYIVDIDDTHNTKNTNLING